jgi:hypothetical protein
LLHHISDDLQTGTDARFVLGDGRQETERIPGVAACLRC